jgi:hypothetical protein
VCLSHLLNDDLLLLLGLVQLPYAVCYEWLAFLILNDLEPRREQLGLRYIIGFFLN